MPSRHAISKADSGRLASHLEQSNTDAQVNPFRVPSAESGWLRWNRRNEGSCQTEGSTRLFRGFLKEVGDFLAAFFGVIDGHFGGLLSPFADAFGGVANRAIGDVISFLDAVRVFTVSVLVPRSIVLTVPSVAFMPSLPRRSIS